jgi:hypothetical protein
LINTKIRVEEGTIEIGFYHKATAWALMRHGRSRTRVFHRFVVQVWHTGYRADVGTYSFHRVHAAITVTACLLAIEL